MKRTFRSVTSCKAVKDTALHMIEMHSLHRQDTRSHNSNSKVIFTSLRNLFFGMLNALTRLNSSIVHWPLHFEP